MTKYFNPQKKKLHVDDDDDDDGTQEQFIYDVKLAYGYLMCTYSSQYAVSLIYGRRVMLIILNVRHELTQQSAYGKKKERKKERRSLNKIDLTLLCCLFHRTHFID